MPGSGYGLKLAAIVRQGGVSLRRTQAWAAGSDAEEQALAVTAARVGVEAVLVGFGAEAGGSGVETDGFPAAMDGAEFQAGSQADL